MVCLRRQSTRQIRSVAVESTEDGSPGTGMPASASPGTGNLTLADLCARYGLHIKLVQRELKKKAPDARLWNDEFDTNHLGEIEIDPMSDDDLKEFWERFSNLPSPLERFINKE